MINEEFEETTSKTQTMKERRADNMYVGYRENAPHLKSPRTSKLTVECYKCDYWCEYEYDVNWKKYFSQRPKQPFWYLAKGQTAMAACGECGTIYCETHSRNSSAMVCPECGSDLARSAIYEVLEKGTK